MITEDKLKKLRGDIANIGPGAKKALAKFMRINPSNITRYLKYGEIPSDRMRQIKEYLQSNK